ncbi:MAG: type II toxin-antitoxin system PemK/MazF family toxin [Peptostreptococcaceae bacterium]
MCKVGDIILVNTYKHGDTVLNKHSFVVVDTDGGKIKSAEYHMNGVVMGSFHNEKHREKKLAYTQNIEILNSETHTSPDNGKDGYVKCDQLYYFNKEKISYSVIGDVSEETMIKIMDHINELAEEGKVTNIIDNL